MEWKVLFLCVERPTNMQLRVSLCRIYCRASFGLLPLISSQSSYDEVPCHFSSPPLASFSFSCCWNCDRRMRVWARDVLSSAVRKPTALSANHDQGATPSFPLVHQLETRYSTTEIKMLPDQRKSEPLLKNTTVKQQFTPAYCQNH